MDEINPMAEAEAWEAAWIAEIAARDAALVPPDIEFGPCVVPTPHVPGTPTDRREVSRFRRQFRPVADGVWAHTAVLPMFAIPRHMRKAWDRYWRGLKARTVG